MMAEARASPARNFMTCLTWTWDSARPNWPNSVLPEVHVMCQLRTAIQSRAVTLFAKARHGDVGGSGALAWAWHLTFCLIRF